VVAGYHDPHLDMVEPAVIPDTGSSVETSRQDGGATRQAGIVIRVLGRRRQALARGGKGTATASV
jgi:hypothetical protein